MIIVLSKTHIVIKLLNNECFTIFLRNTRIFLSVPCTDFGHTRIPFIELMTFLEISVVRPTFKTS